ncbi:MAG: hypothetical protein D084_Lepto4C00686G0002 [Leptospirillum sp. Group IV 'UBA BS']|nr:MAG: hypothetical protein D084_Lepto4C00686G0002 [Leptospirillum sp. Group IV 'UBA BS']
MDPLQGRPNVAQEPPGLIEGHFLPEQLSFVVSETGGEDEEKKASGDQQCPG